MFKCLTVLAKQISNRLSVLVERGVLYALPETVEKAISPVEEAKAAEAAGALPVAEEPDLAVNTAGMSTADLRLALRIKEVENENKKIDTENKRLEVEAMHLRIRALELERLTPTASTPKSAINQSTVGSHPGFDISKHIALVPPFRESDVDSYFSAFERVAAA